MLPTIYVSLTSLPDGELLPTIKNVYEAAEFPERVYVGLVAYGQPKSVKRRLIKWLRKYPTLMIDWRSIPKGSLEEKIKVLGVGAGRNAAMGWYMEQDYVLQIDAHTLLVDNWDSILIRMHTEAQQEVGDKTAILTAYATAYGYEKGKRVFKESCFTYSTYTRTRMFFGVIPGWDDIELNAYEGKKFIPSAKFCANFAFSTGEFALSDSLPDKALFYEEEPIQSVELYSKGFALVFPVVDSPIVGHLYYNDITKRKQRRTALMDYAKGQEVSNSPAFLAQVKETYLGYLARNRDKVKAYEKYARTNLRLGPVNSDLKVPERY